MFQASEFFCSVAVYCATYIDASAKAHELCTILNGSYLLMDCPISVGYPRRKVHLTEQSGFKVFRPRTRDLLLKEPIPQASAGTKWLATRSRQVKGLENPVHEVFFEGSKSSKSVKGGRSSGGLPELFPKHPPSRKPKDGKSTFHVHLPEIVLPS